MSFLFIILGFLVWHLGDIEEKCIDEMFIGRNAEDLQIGESIKRSIR